MTNYKVERNIELNPNGALKLLAIYKDGQAWRNLAYLLLTFPLGIAYFVFLVTGLSVGAGMAITLIGIPILLGVFLLARPLARFDGWLAETLIDAPVAKRKSHVPATEEPLLTRIGNALRDGSRWKEIGYLFLRFPLGVATFTVTMTLVGLSVGMITAPLNPGTAVEIAFWTVNTFPEKVLASLLGVFVGAGSLHAVNFIAGLWRIVVGALLSDGAEKVKNDEL
jgi:hypothetical protein